MVLNLHNKALHRQKNKLKQTSRNKLNVSEECHAPRKRESSNKTKMKKPCVYIMANKRNGTLYTGVTSDAPRRDFEHKNELFEGFSRKYGCKILVYYEPHETMEAAITREKQIKKRSRKYKLSLIESINPDWRDLSGDLH